MCSLVRSLTDIVYARRFTVAYSSGFFAIVGGLVLIEPDLFPIAVAAAFVIPLRFTVSVATRFEESSYDGFSPLWSNRLNPFFVVPLLGLSSLPVFHLLTPPIGWEQFGLIPFCIAVASIAVLAWPEVLYERNFYFDRWHPFERVALSVLGGFSVLSPLFIPLFLLIHYVVTRQFRYPEIGKFNYTHSALPHSMLFILSGVVVASLLFEFQPFMITFLLLCGYAGHYFYPGLEKLRHGPIYYVRNNNPIFLFMNAYKCGWMSFLSEERVANMGVRSERIRPLLNLPILLIQLGTVFIVVSYEASIALGLLTLLFHLLVFTLTGDNFWRWMSVNVALVVGLILTGPLVIFEETIWFAFSVLFIAFATAWSRPPQLGWLDSPYCEIFRLEGILDNGEKVDITPIRLRPYDNILGWGFTGPFLFLCNRDRITFSLGEIHGDKNDHKDIISNYPDDINDTNLKELYEEFGENEYDKVKTDYMCELVERFIVNDGGVRMSVFDAPREFYTQGKTNDKIPLSELNSLRISYIEGVWTVSQFKTIEQKEIIKMDVKNKY